jgi:pimeloyl-ACP methyl ester carboxylesterase
MPGPAWTARTFGPPPETWPLTRRWIGEWMTLDGDMWFSRFTLGGDAAFPPLVMVHGLVVSGTYFRPVAAHLDARYRIAIPDLPGYGHSSTKRRWTMPEFAAALGRWMDAHDLGGAVLVGNSLGCQIITQLAVDRPELVRGMILVAPTVDPDVRNGLHLIGRGIIDIPREQQSLWTVWIPDFFRAGLRRSLRGLRQTMGDDQLERLGRVMQPALVIGGARDPIVPPGWVEAMAGRMPNARSLLLPGQPHAMNYSSPRDLARAIDTVMRGAVGAAEAEG